MLTEAARAPQVELLVPLTDRFIAVFPRLRNASEAAASAEGIAALRTAMARIEGRALASPVVARGSDELAQTKTALEAMRKKRGAEAARLASATMYRNDTTRQPNHDARRALNNRVGVTPWSVAGRQSAVGAPHRRYPPARRPEPADSPGRRTWCSGKSGG